MNALIYSTHGEIPKIVLSPSTAEEAFFDTIEAFNLAEEYQCPVIIASDLALSLGKQTLDPLDYEQVEIRRGKLVDEVPEAESDLFNRFAVTEDGISPRILPGTKNGLTHVTGVEHGENGRPSEAASNRKVQMDKRLRKLNNFHYSNALNIAASHERADVLIVGVGSTTGPITEAKERLEKEGHKVNHIHTRILLPFPTEQIKPYVEAAEQVVVVENNATAQLADLLKLHLGHADKIQHVLKYDGNPFLPHEIEEGILHQMKELV